MTMMMANLMASERYIRSTLFDSIISLDDELSDAHRGVSRLKLFVAGGSRAVLQLYTGQTPLNHLLGKVFFMALLSL